ncbi:MAG: hypothetical protein ACE5KF_03940 [Kiloniellaceae bacterium]
MDQRNLILAIVLSVVILLTFQFLYVEPQRQRMQQAQQAEQPAPQPGVTVEAPAPGTLDLPRPPGAPDEAPAALPGRLDRAQLTAQTPRVKIESRG